MIILTINCGSSSFKYCLFDTEKKEMLIKGVAERIGLPDSFTSLKKGSDKKIIKVENKNHREAIKFVLDLLVSTNNGVISNLSEIDAVAHRVVHGGEKFVKSILITEKIEDTIDKLSHLAPLHNPANLQGIRAAKTELKSIPHIAVFDTAFHQTIPAKAYRYAIPTEMYEEHSVRKYGFHGTSHYFVSRRALKILNKQDAKIITLHLGNGASIAAINSKKSIDTSMGFTPLEGLIMGTRSGDIDAGVIFYLLRNQNLTVDKVDNILNRKSGLKGITSSKESAGLSDMRDIEAKAAKGDEKAKLALDMVAYRISKYIGAYFVALNGLDCIVFTAGIGENSVILREMVISNLECLGISINKKLNENVIGEKIISSDDSKVKVLVIPTNEELVMAKDAEKIVKRI